jgi:uncharacterized membrane protein
VTFHDELSIVSVAAGWLCACWSLCGMVISAMQFFGARAPRIVRAVFHELKPFYIPAAVVVLLADTMLHRGLLSRLITLAAMVANWFFYRNLDDDDDRWKRRKAKLAEQVRQVGSRLTVAPAEVPA